MKQKETRNLFFGHARSSDPSIAKVIDVIQDCITDVLSVDYPPKIINIDDYLKEMDKADFDRNSFAIETALSDLPETYKDILANKFFTSYINQNSSSILRSNIELVCPILWNVLSKEVKKQVIRRIDKVFAEGNSTTTDIAFHFVEIVKGFSYLSIHARKYKIVPHVKKLTSSLDKFSEENSIVAKLEPYSSMIPNEILSEYVSSLTKTYVGRMGHSIQFNRTDFYADVAAMRIPKLFENFDNNAASAFIECIKKDDNLRSRIRHPQKLRRLRTLARIVFDKISDTFPDKELLSILLNEKSELDFIKAIQL